MMRIPWLNPGMPDDATDDEENPGLQKSKSTGDQLLQKLSEAQSQNDATMREHAAMMPQNDRSIWAKIGAGLSAGLMSPSAGPVAASTTATHALNAPHDAAMQGWKAQGDLLKNDGKENLGLYKLMNTIDNTDSLDRGRVRRADHNDEDEKRRIAHDAEVAKEAEAEGKRKTARNEAQKWFEEQSIKIRNGNLTETQKRTAIEALSQQTRDRAQKAIADKYDWEMTKPDKPLSPTQMSAQDRLESKKVIREMSGDPHWAPLLDVNKNPDPQKAKDNPELALEWNQVYNKKRSIKSDFTPEPTQ